LAVDRGDVHPDPQAAEGPGGCGRGAEILRLGLQERRQKGRRAGLRAPAAESGGGGPQSLGGKQGSKGEAHLREGTLSATRACLQLSRIVIAASCTPARKFLASLS